MNTDNDTAGLTAILNEENKNAIEYEEISPIVSQDQSNYYLFICFTAPP